MSVNTKQRKVGSPWRRGIGILRVPDDVNHVAIAHHQNKLKWRAFRQWQVATLQMRLDRILNEAVEMRYEQQLVLRLFRRWKCRLESNKCLQFICNQVQSLQLNTFEAIRQQCRRFGQMNTRTAWLVFVVRFSQLKLCRRVLHIWRSRIGRSKALVAE